MSRDPVGLLLSGLPRTCERPGPGPPVQHLVEPALHTLALSCEPNYDQQRQRAKLGIKFMIILC
jgi:hypothetical protein